VIDNDQIVDPWLGERAAQAEVELRHARALHIAHDHDGRHTRLKRDRRVACALWVVIQPYLRPGARYPASS
jgi:hypothetical protein